MYLLSVDSVIMYLQENVKYLLLEFPQKIKPSVNTVKKIIEIIKDFGSIIPRVPEK